MSLDLNTILSSMLGSLIALVGSITVALLYIRNQNKADNKRRLNESIQETYIEHGILPMQEALTEYGINSVFGINDLRIWAVRTFKFGRNHDVLRNKINEIKNRPTITDLISRKFSYAMGSFSYLRRFGMPVYGSIIRTLQHYSEMLSDILEYEQVCKTVEEAGIDEFGRSCGAVAQMVEMSQLYLQTRLDNLKDYIWENDFENYTEFLNIISEEKYTNFVSDLDQYIKLLTALMDSMKGPNPEFRKEASLAFSKWLGENRDKNPLQSE